MAILQAGTKLEVGFQGYVYTLLLMESADYQRVSDKEYVKDENNADGTLLVSDRGTRLSLTGIILNDGTNLTDILALKKGDVLTINLVDYFIDGDPKISFSRGAAKLTVDLFKPDSMSPTTPI